MIKQVYIPYWEWEDYINGMYRRLSSDEEKLYTKKATLFMNNIELFGETMREVVNTWGKTMINSLTNPAINKNAFVGQCALSFKLNCPEYITRNVWKHISIEKRNIANKLAERHINEWLLNYERKNKSVHKDMGIQMLFEWNT